MKQGKPDVARWRFCTLVMPLSNAADRDSGTSCKTCAGAAGIWTVCKLLGSHRLPFTQFRV